MGAIGTESDKEDADSQANLRSSKGGGGEGGYSTTNVKGVGAGKHSRGEGGPQLEIEPF